MSRRSLYFLYCVGLYCWVQSAFAVQPRSPTLGGVAVNMMGPVTGVISIFRAISIIAGIGMVLSSFAKFSDHLQNRSEITMGLVLTIFVTGVCLIIVGFIPFMGS